MKVLPYTRAMKVALGPCINLKLVVSSRVTPCILAFLIYLLAFLDAFHYVSYHLAEIQYILASFLSLILAKWQWVHLFTSLDTSKKANQRIHLALILNCIIEVVLHNPVLGHKEFIDHMIMN